MDLLEVLQLFILGLITLIIRAEGSLPSNCTRSCGNISNIDYPFGIEKGCFHAIGFNLSCINDRTTNFTPTLVLGDGTIKIRQIDMEQGILCIESPIITMGVDEQYINTTMIDLKNWPYSFNIQIDERFRDSHGMQNYVYFVGCSVIANLIDLKANSTYLDTCFTMCSANDPSQPEFSYSSESLCYIYLDGVNTSTLGIQLVRLNEKELNLVNTSSITTFIADDYYTIIDDIQELITRGNNTGVTATLAWYINDGHPTCKEAEKNNATYACHSANSDCYDAFRDYNIFRNSTSVGYICRCSSGYHGNPYLHGGCRGSNFTLSPAKGCARKCGSMDIPFPFGLKKGCYRDESFHLKCNETAKPPTLSFRYFSTIVNNISLEEGQLELNIQEHDLIDKNDPFTSVGVREIYNWVIEYQSCDNAKEINRTTYACVSKDSKCVEVKNTSNGDDIFGYRCKCSKGFTGNPYLLDGCTDINECNDTKTYVCYGVCNNIEGDYNCTCPTGSSGDPKKNPCIPNPKRSTLLLDIIAGISSSMGLLILCAIIFILRRKFKERHDEKMRKRYFLQNHGLLLKQLISSGEDIADRTKIFSLEELEKATNNFDKTRVLGRGGHGTVYKGILSDQRVVAIKKSKIVKKSEIDQFINEVAILSQINHRHVVRLFGCCLETKVPLLIYEFISNGALSDHLHVADGNSILPWEDRLRIATEAAGALAYLHSAASISILHRDVKSSNILLDDHFAAKVSDFGASRFIPLDQTHIITGIQGTFGYLDPEYYQTSQLTQKSDVYSFGVILLELLTGKKPVYTTEDRQDLNLSMHFLQAIRVNRPFDLMDDRVMKESNDEELNEIFQLVQMCLKLKGVGRPTMKEVEHKLQSLRKIRMKKKGHYTLGADAETEHLLNATLYTSSDGTSRNYSMEKEVMWSQYHPR